MAGTQVHFVLFRPREGMVAITCLLRLLVLVVALPSLPTIRGELPTPAVELGTTRIEPRHHTVFAVPNDSSLAIGMAAHGWKEAEILIEASEPHADYTILSPEGKAVRSGSTEAAGWQAVYFPVSVDGLYQLVVSAKSKARSEQGLRLRVELLPFATPSGGRLKKAEALYTAAEALRISLRATDVREAIAKYRQAASDWEAAGDDEALVLALSGEAQAWLELGDRRSAIGALHRAIALCAGSVYFRSWLLNLEAQVYLVWWDSRSASAVAKEALKLGRSLNDTELIADALVDQGASEWLTDTESAAGDIDEALRLAHECGRTETIGLALRYKSWIEEDHGHLTRALSLMQQAEETFQAAGDSRDVLQAMSNIATIEGLEGDRYSALLQHSKLASPFIVSGDTENYGTVLENIAADYAALNRDRDAILYLKKSVGAYQRIDDDSGISINLGLLCMAELRQKRLKEALRDCRSADFKIKQTHDPKLMAISTWRLGKVHQAFGQLDLAIANYKRAASLSEQVPDPRFESQSLIDWGDALEAAHDSPEALPLFQKGLSLSERAEDSTVQLEARFRVARWYANAGESAEAIGQVTIALGQIKKKRSSVRDGGLQASYFAAVRKCYDLYVDILMREHELTPGSPSDILALEISESARARTLLDALHARGLDESLKQREDTSAQQIELRNVIEQAYDQRLKLMLEGGHKRELDENSATLTQAINSLERMEDADKDEAKIGVPAGPPLTAQQIVEASKSSGSTFLEFSLGPQRSYLWVVNQGTIKSRQLPGIDRIENTVKQWRELVTSRQYRPNESFAEHLKRVDAADRELPRIASALSCMLLGSSILPQMGRLVIVPDGDLEFLSFASLPSHGCDNTAGPPLAASHQVIKTPSLSVFLTQRDAPQTPFRGDVAIVADPVFDRNDVRVRAGQEDEIDPAVRGLDRRQLIPSLPRLIGTRDEALAITSLVGPERASLALDFSASLQTVLSPTMADYRIWHLATHGIGDDGAPGFSGLVFSLVRSDGRPEFGYLKAHDIADLNLRTELVVLNSCDSAAGDNLSGEGVTGLSYAFLQAGVKQVISILWSVDDETSKQLIVAFYEEMLRDGKDPAEALRRSQLRIMQQPHKSAPFYWAGFVITSAGS